MLNYQKNQHFALLARYVSKDYARPYITGVYVEEDGTLTATDGHRIIRLLAAPSPGKEYLGKILSVTPKGFGLPIADQTFPDWKQLLPNVAKAKHVFRFNRWVLPKSIAPGSTQTSVSVMPSGMLALGGAEGALVALDLAYLLDVPDDCSLYIFDAAGLVLFGAPDLDWLVGIMPTRDATRVLESVVAEEAA